MKTSFGSFQFQSTLPCGSDLKNLLHCLRCRIFQSTLPCGSDTIVFASTKHINNFNPRSLAGATLMLRQYADVARISIHAPLRERRLFRRQDNTEHNFNPRSLAGATGLFTRSEDVVAGISIHAPLRERRQINSRTFLRPRFQSTLPCGSDINIHHRAMRAEISIHAPLRERLCSSCTNQRHSDFNPRSLAGATVDIPAIFQPPTISIHAPLRERLIVIAK